MPIRILAPLVLLALLAGCSSAPKQGSAGVWTAESTVQTTPASTASAKSASSSVSTSAPGAVARARSTGTTSTHAPLIRTLPPVNQDIVFHAIGLVGIPYRYGGSNPETGFDCSGLIKYVYQQAVGMSLPRTTAGLNALAAKNPAVGSLQPGDLVLFAMNGGNRVNHAGIYVGDGRFLHAPSTGGKVRVDDMQSNFWQRTYTGARRVLQ